MKIKLTIFLLLCGSIFFNTVIAEQHEKEYKYRPIMKTPPTGKVVKGKPHKLKPINLGSLKPRPKPSKGCCSPVNPDTVAAALKFVHGNGGLTANYTLRFNPSSLFKNQMQSYVNYIHYLSGGAVNAVIINWNMRECGTGSQPAASCSGIIPQTNHWTEWGFGGNGSHTGGNFFNYNTMQVNKWYYVHTGTYLDKYSDYYLDKKKCANNGIYVRVSVLKSARGGAQLQISNGRKIIKTVPLR